MKKAKKLHLDYIVASNAGDKRHAQEIMRGLGISWLSARPEPIADCWIFEGCANVPPILPSFIREVS